MAAWDGVPVDDSSDGFLDQPGQDPVDEPDEGFVVDPTDPTGVDQARVDQARVDQARVDQAGVGDAELVAGTSIEDMGKILDYYGLSTEQHHNATLDDLQQALANGDGVMVGVDSDEIWTPGFDPGESLDAYPGIPGQGADHAIQVIGLDYTDPVNPVVVLNDPGSPAGQGETVPLETFLEAWEDSGNFLVTAHGSRAA